MVRLIRLASVDNGKFKTSFGNDIVIEPGSKISVLNATFETKLKNIQVSRLNNQFKFLPSVDDGLSADATLFEMNPRNYSGKLGVIDFFRDMNVSLNATLGYVDTTLAGGAKVNAGVFSEFELRMQEPFDEFPEPVEPTEIRYVLNPIVYPFGPTWSMAYPTGSRNAPLLIDNGAGDRYFNWGGGDIGTGGTDAERYANQIERVGTTPVVGTTIRAEAAEGIVMSKGSGLWMARVGNSIDNTSTLQDNGFGIGLSNDLFNVGVDEDIPANLKMAEVRFNRETETYKFSVSGGAEQDSGVSPVRVTTTYPLQDHDIMWIRVGKNQRADQSTADDPTFGKLCLQGGVWVDSGASATEHIFFSVELTRNDLIYEYLRPYLFMNGAPSTIFADATAFTPSITNLMNSQDLDAPFWGPHVVGEPTATGRNEYEILNDLKNGNGAAYPLSVIGRIVPQIDPGRFDQDLSPRTTELTIHADILRYLGFGSEFSGYQDLRQKMGMDNLEFQNLIEYKADGGANLDDDDNFIVESMTLPVDSYDASEQFYGDNNPVQQIGLNPSAERLGRRKNIIATIPVSNQETLVQYEASTPQFIDLRNKSILNERNLEFRILDKNFENIETGSSKSILTLLIAGPGER